MSKLVGVLGVGLLVLVVLLYWKLTRKSEVSTATIPAVAADAAPLEKSEPPPRARKDAGTPQRDAADGVAAGSGDGSNGPKELLTPRTPAYNHKLDVHIPDLYRAEMAKRCDYKKTTDADVAFNYSLKIEGGRVTISNLKVLENEADEQTLRCFRNVIETATFDVPEMPDFAEDDVDLYIGLRSLRKYKSRAEFDD